MARKARARPMVTSNAPVPTAMSRVPVLSVPGPGPASPPEIVSSESVSLGEGAGVLGGVELGVADGVGGAVVGVPDGVGVPQGRLALRNVWVLLPSLGSGYAPAT